MVFKNIFKFIFYIFKKTFLYIFDKNDVFEKFSHFFFKN